VLLAGPTYRVLESATATIWRQLGAVGAAALLIALAYAAYFGDFNNAKYFGGDFGSAALGRRLFAHDALATEAIAALVLVALLGATIASAQTIGLRFHPILGRWRNHTGTDYAAPMGTPVRSVGDGVIIAKGWHGGYGNAIDIRHNNGMVTRYGHMRNFAKGMRAGRRVNMGTTIGYVGMTGLATGPHLHFEVRFRGAAVDPRSALP